MDREEFEFLTTIEGVHGDRLQEELDILCIPVKKFTPLFYKFLQDNFNVMLIDVEYNYEEEQLEAWFEEA